MKIEVKLILGGVIALTSACSSGSDGTVAFVDQTFSERLLVVADMNNAAEVVGLADSGLLPTTGTSTYTGATYLLLDDVASAEVILMVGALEVNVDFATDELSGGSTDFVDATDTDYTGELVIANDNLNRGGDPAFDFWMDGQLTNTDSDVTYFVNTDVEGDFYGTDLEYIAGDITPSTAETTSTDFVTYTVTGNIVGELQ